MLTQAQMPDGPALKLLLYVAGDAPNSVLALANLRAALADLAEPRVELEIIDVLREPDRGFCDGVLVTPMLVRTWPGPERRVLGNLSARSVLLGVLAREVTGHE